jgi:hypothetical protein
MDPPFFPDDLDQLKAEEKEISMNISMKIQEMLNVQSSKSNDADDTHIAEKKKKRKSEAVGKPPKEKAPIAKKKKIQSTDDDNSKPKKQDVKKAKENAGREMSVKILQKLAGTRGK